MGGVDMSKGRPWKTREIDGFEVLIGRDAAGNVELTHSLQKGDMWLHVADGLAGSHVVVRQGEQAEDCVIEQAARWAAWHSSARRNTEARVYVCRADEVAAVNLDGTARISVAKIKRVSPEDVAAKPQPAPQAPDPLYSAVQGGLRQAIHAHGPITDNGVPSATKRVLAAVRAVLEGKT